MDSAWLVMAARTAGRASSGSGMELAGQQLANTPVHQTSQKNTQRDTTGTPMMARVPAALPQGVGMRRSFPRLPALPVWAGMLYGSPLGEQPDRRGQEAAGETPGRAQLEEGY